jgi:hypothetical protein
VSIQDIEVNVSRPLYLSPQVKVMEVLEADPFQRFMMMGFGPESHVMIRNFRYLNIYICMNMFLYDS